MIRRGRCVALAALVLVLAPSVARADDPAMTDAKARFSEGVARYKKSDYEGARLAFLQAYVVLHSTDVLINLALSELNGTQPLDALAHLRQYAKEPTADPDVLAKLPRLLNRANALVGHIKVVAPVGATIDVDGTSAPQTAPLDAPLDVAPGAHVVGARPVGANDTLHANVVAVAGDEVNATFTGTAGPTPSDPHAHTAASSASPPAVQAPGRGSAERPAEAGPDTARVVVSMILLGAGATVAIVGTVFAVTSNADADDAQRLRTTTTNCSAPNTPACAPLQQSIDSAQSNATTAKILYAGGALLGVAAAVTWFAWPRPADSKKTAWVAPTMGSGAFGVAAGGTF